MKKDKILNNELFTDFKAVALAADLIEREIIEAENVEVIPVGSDKRAFAKDIEQSQSYYLESRRQNRLRIQVNREGLYDMLPEGLFHRPPKGSSAMDEEGMIKDIRERREEEKAARLFFSPFDVELNHARVMAELYENMLDKKTTYTELNRIFEKSWAEFDLLDKRQSIIWMHLIPEIQQRRNDMPFISKILNALFNLPVEISDNSNHIKLIAIDAQMQMQLGKSALGIDTIIGKEFMPEHEAIKVKIGPAHPSSLISFIPGGKNRAVLEMALSYLVPIDTEVQTELLTDPSFRQTTLSQNGEASYLGYTVFL